MTLADSVLAGDRLALSRLLTQIENETPEGRTALSVLYPHTGRAHLIGVTGAPGTGKSSLVNQLARHYRHSSTDKQARRVAIIAIDPSSPFSGGALLGDRIRMRDLSGDPGVYIRSMASRGSLGGLAKTTAGLVEAFDAAGFDAILIETVGAGQAEVDIARLAHTTLVVEAPGMGDEVQAIKAGILEIADILVVNKADRPGVENTERALRGMLELAHPTRRGFRRREQNQPASGQAKLQDRDIWIPPIIKTVSTEGNGIQEVAEAIDRHKSYLNETGDWDRRERARIEAELEMLLQSALVTRWRTSANEKRYQEILNRLADRNISPYQAVNYLLDGERSR